MSNAKGRIVRVAAVQIESKNGLVEANLEHATPLVEQAAKGGARLILLPEFMPTGYIFSTAIWDGAEPKRGPTVQWLRENSRKYGVWLGTSFLEADGEDFFNTFVLATPDGEEAGRVRKQTPAGFEAFYTRSGIGPHVIDTELGKIGIGICYENQLTYIPQIMQGQSADILLMPHSFPTVGQIIMSLRDLAPRYARLLGIPTVVCNKSGPWRSPYPGIPFYTANTYFPGLTTIADSDGSVKAQLGDEEKVIIADVTLDPDRKAKNVAPCSGRWAWRGPWIRDSARVIEAVGRLWYSFSSERKRKALKVSSTT
jgi:N-carbamoylputrescine amidase